jgi:ATP-dependent DNA helicase Q1
VESQISKLQSFRSTLKSERSTLASSLLARRCSKPIPSNSRAKVVSKAAVDYSGQFPWSAKAKSIAKDVFGIDNFRLEQESAINASMDGREIVCVMPTGGGKSLIYQLPALLTPGTTLVITPLISLMQDQTYNLRQNSVRAEMLNSATSKEDAKMITARMVNGGKANVPKGKGKGKGKGKDIKPMKKEVDWDAEEEEDETEEDEREIKLVYVSTTPIRP